MVHRLSPVALYGFSLGSTDSVLVVHRLSLVAVYGLSCPKACGILVP